MPTLIEIKQSLGLGLCISTVANQFDVSEKLIDSLLKCPEWGLIEVRNECRPPRHRLTDVEAKKVKYLSSLGFTHTVIGQVVGCDSHAASKIVRGLSHTDALISADDIEAFVCSGIIEKANSLVSQKRDSYKKKRSPIASGSRNPNSILKDETVIGIASLIREGISNTQIAQKMGVSMQVVASIKSGRTWGHLTEIDKCSLTRQIKRFTKKEREDILSMLNSGLSGAEIARRLGCDKSTINKMKATLLK